MLGSEQAGEAAIKEYGSPLPGAVMDSINRNKVALKGPLTTPVGAGYRSVNVALRRTLDLYINLRPIQSYKGIKSIYQDIDLVIIRENTEDFHRIEHMVAKCAESIKVITRKSL